MNYKSGEPNNCVTHGAAAVPKICAENLARIDEGIAAAERGDFATEEEVRAEFARWRGLSR
jgi:predicted transcriptional regulator